MDLNLGVRNKKRTLGTTLAFSYLFGSDESYQIVSNSFASINLKRTSNLALRLRPNISFVIADQNITFVRPVRTPTGPQLRVFTQDVFDLLNTQLSIPISLSTNSWDFELGYNLNLPKALPNETDLSTTGFFNFSVGYMFDLNKK
ncbi:hypothetical protein BTO18_05190 [Polaribacter porphyrae]|uniref:Outer membrane protein beta-barrel domain-containing protein n=1 Tax=Polaribacter porphyrae TaxID=1137780 RepID=A0A2S7WUA9_9FLAO|nr:hypothetical protein BTO18_05190 [Polaribacter porphyrae]